MHSTKLSHIYGPNNLNLGTTALDFISRLDSPTVIHIEGKDNTRCRVLVTLLHGNEPSGVKALHSLLIEGFEPEVNIKVIIASVEAAKAAPVFTHRMLMGRRDLNRCFGTFFDDIQGQLAQSIIHVIKVFQPEAIIDMHNTSGNGPGFCVGLHQKPKHLALASLFAREFILTDIELGSLMEYNFNCPIITVEAGGSGNSHADKLAYDGLKAFFSEDNIFATTQEMKLIKHPRRLELFDNSTLDFGTAYSLKNNVTMRHDIEKFNFGFTPKGTELGWVDISGLHHFRLDKHSERLSDTFEMIEGCLVTKVDLSLFMVTTRADIAKSDCLFYFAPH